MNSVLQYQRLWLLRPQHIVILPRCTLVVCGEYTTAAGPALPRYVVLPVAGVTQMVRLYSLPRLTFGLRLRYSYGRHG